MRRTFLPLSYWVLDVKAFPSGGLAGIACRFLRTLTYKERETPLLATRSVAIGIQATLDETNRTLKCFGYFSKRCNRERSQVKRRSFCKFSHLCLQAFCVKINQTMYFLTLDSFFVNSVWPWCEVTEASLLELKEGTCHCAKHPDAYQW
jgi:hypothetical protein